MKARQRDGSGYRHYRYLMEDTDRHGNVRVYFRRAGRKIRMREKPGTGAFDREYRIVFEGGTLPPRQGGPSKNNVFASTGTFRWLCERYYASPSFTSLTARTRRVRRNLLDTIAERLGNRPVSMMRPQDIAKLRDEKSDKPAAANQLVKVIRSVFNFATDTDYNILQNNPAKEVRLLKSTNPDGFKAWLDKDADRFEKRFPVGTKARLAFDLLIYTGVRRSDVVRLGPSMEQDGKLVFAETKGGFRKKHAIPILPILRISINSTATTGMTTYLVNRYGKPYSPDSFGEWFKQRCLEAGLTDLSAHGIRKLSATRCVEAGATQAELMALFGWSNPEHVTLYTRKANRAKLESKAAHILAGIRTNR